MRHLYAIALLGLTACTMAPPPPPPPPPPVETSWRATLQANPGFEGVRGTVSARSSMGGTGVTINFGDAFGASGTIRPWHIHFGRCGSQGGIAGDPNAYPLLRTGANGTASASTTIRVELGPGNDYYVNVHKSSAEMGTIIACGQLSPEM